MDFATFVSVAVMAVLIEAVVNAVKPIWSAEARAERNLVSFYVALATGVVLAVLGGVDVFAAADVPLTTFSFLEPWAGTVFTGVILSRGANVVADILNKLRSILIVDDEQEFNFG